MAAERRISTMARVDHRLFDAQTLALLQDPRRWRLASTLFPAEAPLVDDRAHRHWRLRHTHAHAHREFLIALDGDALYGHVPGIFRCAPGTVLYFDSGEAHDDGYPSTVEGIRHLWLMVASGWVSVNLLASKQGRLQPLMPMLGLGAAELGFDAAAALDRCRAESREHPELARLDLLSVVQAIAARVIEAGWRQDTGASGTHQSRAIAAVRRHVSDTAGAGASLDALALLSGYSRFHLVRLFKRETGMGLGDWIDRCRLERVQQLQKAGKSLAEAAQALGFSSPSALSRWCARHGVRWTRVPRRAR